MGLVRTRLYLSRLLHDVQVVCVCVLQWCMHPFEPLSENCLHFLYELKHPLETYALYNR